LKGVQGYCCKSLIEQGTQNHEPRIKLQNDLILSLWIGRGSLYHGSNNLIQGIVRDPNPGPRKGMAPGFNLCSRDTPRGRTIPANMYLFEIQLLTKNLKLIKKLNIFIAPPPFCYNSVDRWKMHPL